MNLKSKDYLKKLHEMYDGWIDKDFIEAIRGVEEDQRRITQLSSLEDHPFVLDMKEKAIEMFKISLEHLTNRERAMRMNEEERAYAFAMMDWSKLMLDAIGQPLEVLEQALDDTILLYAKKAGIAV